MANKITQVIDVDTKGGIKNVGALTTELEGAESAGKQVAKALGQMADHIETDMKETAAAADMLGAALGPELAAKIGQNGLIDMVADLKKLGLTSADIEADVDQLAASIKHLDTVGAGLNGPQKGLKDVEQQADRTQGAVRNLGNESDNSRSVMANMAGNSAQDIAAIGGASSTAGMALGQMAEYASEGNISLKGLGKVVGPMAAITVATMAMAQGSKQAAARAKELAQAYEDLTTATDAQALTVWSKMALDAALSGRNLKDMLLEMAEASPEGARRLLDLSIAAGMTTDQTKLLRDAIDEQAAAVKRGAENTEKYGTAVEDLGTKSEETTGVVVGGFMTMVTATEDAITATENATKATEEYARRNDSLSRQVQSDLDKIAGKWDALTGKIDDNEVWANLQLDFMSLKESGEAAMKGLAEGTEEGRKAILDHQIAVDQNKKSIIDYAKEVLGIPSERVTNILTAVDAGDLERAELLLANLTRNRNVSISIIAKGGAGYEGGGSGTSATGGMESGPTLVGEQGPEVVDLPNGSNVHTAANTAAMLGGGLHIDQVIFQVQTMPTPDQAMRQIETWRRRNGNAKWMAS